MITCDGCYMDVLHDNDNERARCIGRRICEGAYQQGRADAIDEFTSALHDLIVSCGNYVSTAEIRLLAEQLKEQTDDIRSN